MKQNIRFGLVLSLAGAVFGRPGHFRVYEILALFITFLSMYLAFSIN